jgi:DEAD/DEAH box helicase domain-containing protein
MFASRFNDDKKTLAFSDNVQDAAHHAGFFNTRTWRFGMRSAIQRYAQNGGDGQSLEDFSKGFIDYWKKQWSTEEFVGRLIAPNMVWMHAYENMTETGTFGNGKLEKKLLKDIEQRSKYEIMLEYGLSSRIGRTLEKSGCSTLAFETSEVEKVAATVRERVINELGALTKTDQAWFDRMVIGFLNIMRQNGAFDDRAFDLYSTTGQSFDLSNNQKTKRDWMPGVQTGRNTPRFIFVPAKPGVRLAAFDQVTSRKYTDWLSGCTDEFLVGENVFDDVAQIIFEELKKAGIIVQMPGGADFTVWALSKKHVFVTTDVKQFTCDTCGNMNSVAAENVELWEGAPCLRTKCGGHLIYSPAASLGYYGKLYSTGDMVRVVAQEHTGLLERTEREKIEKIFKQSGPDKKPWDTNVLSCTPTLEMGIDIGDLSTVIMCSVPPAQPQFLQRAGRAGRKDGNALTIAVANAKPHDLYFYADPMDMIAGKVEPPTVFLQASAVLERQFVAYCLDSWIRRAFQLQLSPRL